MKIRALCVLSVLLTTSCRDSPPLAPVESEANDVERPDATAPNLSLTAEQASLTGRIVFSRITAGGTKHDIYVINADGSNPTRITDHPLSEYEPAWSPQGGRIAFQRGSGILESAVTWLVESDGSQPTMLRQGLSPAWAPNGLRIAFWGPDIFVMNADGSSPVNLTQSPATDRHPSWSPNGSRIAYDRRPGSASGQHDIWVMDADGSNQERLTFEGGNFQPAWSPDGSKIAFESNRTGVIRIWVMNANGTNPVRLTDSPSPGSDKRPAWSPDGEWIVFARSYGLYAIDKTGSHLIQLTDQFGDTYPDWTFGEGPDPIPDVRSLLGSVRDTVRDRLGDTMENFVVSRAIDKVLAELAENRFWAAKLRMWSLSLRIDALVDCCLSTSDAALLNFVWLRPMFDGLGPITDVPKNAASAKTYAQILASATVQLPHVIERDRFRPLLIALNRAIQAASRGSLSQAGDRFCEAKALGDDSERLKEHAGRIALPGYWFTVVRQAIEITGVTC